MEWQGDATMSSNACHFDAESCPDAAALSVAGPDARGFLQGLRHRDVEALGTGQARLCGAADAARQDPVRFSVCSDGDRLSPRLRGSQTRGAAQAARLLQIARQGGDRAARRSRGGRASPRRRHAGTALPIRALPTSAAAASRPKARCRRPTDYARRGASRSALPTARPISVRASSFRMRPISTSWAASASARAAMSARKWCRAWNIAARRAAASCPSQLDGAAPVKAANSGRRETIGTLLSSAGERALGACSARPAGGCGRGG